jgi:hypothetical protein
VALELALTYSAARLSPEMAESMGALRQKLGERVRVRDKLNKLAAEAEARSRMLST